MTHIVSIKYSWILSARRPTMFRKPKASFKKAKAASFKRRGEVGDAPSSSGGGGGRYRKRSASASSAAGGEGDSGGGGGARGESGGSTTDLLEQIRREKRQQQNLKKPGKRGRFGGAADDGDGDDGRRGVMHEYGATDDRTTTAQMATRTAEHHPADITPGTCVHVLAAPPSSTGDGGEGGGDGKTYRGHNAGQARNKFLAGPIKAPTFVRTTARFDYQPDICKDYKDTGFCGFGDTCIYLHDRGDTLSGWQLEAQYEEEKKRERDRKEKEMNRFLAKASSSGGEGVDFGDDDDDDDGGGGGDGLPFACHLCRNPFTDPVVTRCGHYYCEKCIIDRVRATNASCPICGKDTGGVFNYPSKLLSKKRRLVGSEGTWEEFAEANNKNK